MKIRANAIRSTSGLTPEQIDQEVARLLPDHVVSRIADTLPAMKKQAKAKFPELIRQWAGGYPGLFTRYRNRSRRAWLNLWNRV
jgi:hypothetical protein